MSPSNEPPTPTPVELIFLADFGPIEDVPDSIKKCRRRMTRIRRNLGFGNVTPAKANKELEANRQTAIAESRAICKRCGACEG